MSVSAETEESRAIVKRRRIGVMSAGAVVVVVLAAVLLTSRPAQKSSVTVKGGGAAKNFEIPNLQRGEPVVSLASFKGQPVVLNFWASWCIPCRREMPAFQAVAEKVKGKVAFVGVNHQDGRSAGLDLVKETGVRYPSGYDPGGKVAAAYGLFGMPTTLFISPEGNILERRSGEMSRQELEDALKRLFAV